MSFDQRQRSSGAPGAQGHDAFGVPGKRTLVEQALRPAGGGAAMPADVRAKMEQSFGFDFSAVRIHEGPHAGAVNAHAFTQGTDIHMAPGQYAPHDAKGQELLGHELAHVVQQAQGRVAATGQAKGADLNDDPSLEHEADVAGARAARGERADGVAGPSADMPAPLPAFAPGPGVLRKVIQRQRGIDDTQVEKITQLGTTLSSFDGEGTKVAATLDYVQLGAPGTWDAGAYDSSYALPGGTYTQYAYGKDKKKGHDAEAKLLDVVAGQLTLLGFVAPVTRATLHIRGNRGPCNRCQGVIVKFQSDFPMVEVKSYYEQDRRVVGSSIENDMGKGNYTNGYPDAMQARTAYVGVGRVGELGDLWYRHLQSENDHQAGIDPVDEMRQEQELARKTERRATFVALLKDRKERIFRSQTRTLPVKESHELTARKQRGKSDTVSGHERDIEFGSDERPSALEHGITLQWRVPAKRSAIWTVTAIYPGHGCYEEHHATVPGQLQTLVTGKLTYKHMTSTTPAPGAKRAQFDPAFDTYVSQIEAGAHDGALLAFDGRHLDLAMLPPLVT